MASNYWDSTQRRYWQFTREQLASMRQKLEDDDQNLVQMFPLPQTRHLNIFFNQQINRLGKRLGVRQQAMATAQIYLKRFYTKVEVRRTNPYLVMTTALYLACKMEECPQHIRLVIGEAKALWPDLHCLEIPKVGECEFFMISEMNSHLIIHQPYRTLTQLQGDFSLSSDESSVAWSVINDHYMTDLPLLFPPHVVALTGILLALVLQTPIRGNASNSGTAAGMSMSAANAAFIQAQAQARAALQGGAITPGGTPSLGLLTPGLPGQVPQQSQMDPATAQKAQETRAKIGKLVSWLSDSNVDIEAMVNCTQELLSFYECHDQYNDKLTRDQINRCIKARGLER